MRLLLSYFADPHVVQIDLLSIGPAHRQPHDVLPYEDPSPQARQFITDITSITGIAAVELSNTARQITVRKLPLVTWAETMVGILEILRDRFAPNQSLTQDMMQDLPRCVGRSLKYSDFQALPKAFEQQALLF